MLNPAAMAEADNPPDDPYPPQAVEPDRQAGDRDRDTAAIPASNPDLAESPRGAAQRMDGQVVSATSIAGQLHSADEADDITRTHNHRGAQTDGRDS